MAQINAWSRPALVGAVAVVLGSIVLTSTTEPLTPTSSMATIAGTLGYALAAVLIRYGWARSGPTHRFGTANIVTLARLVGTCWIVSLTVTLDPGTGIHWPALWISVIAGACLILDGVDGRLARGRGEASSFGARFDIEVDAATTLILAIAVPVAGIGGWWVIIMGALRYAYLVAGLVQPALRRPLPFSQSRRGVGLGQAVLLVISLFLAGVSEPLAESGRLAILPAIGLAGLLWSFGRDAVRQLRD